MSNQKTEKLGLKKSLSYGMGAIGEGIGYNFFYSYFIYSLTKEKYALLLTAAEAKENGVEYRVEGLERVL